MDLTKIMGVLIIIMGILIGLIHFNILHNVIPGINLVNIGIIIFVFHELMGLITHLFKDGNKMISVGVPLLFIIVASSYFVRDYIPIIGEHITLIIPVIMVVEGLYRLH
ncbi:MAG: hypothetical protein ABIC04_01055 [Nanoarchaeota archaeon]